MNVSSYAQCAICGKHHGNPPTRFYVVQKSWMCVFCVEEAAVQRVGSLIDETMKIREYALEQLHALESVLSRVAFNTNTLTGGAIEHLKQELAEISERVRGDY